MNFGTIIKRLRLNRNLTQEELGKIINKNRSTIAGYETEHKQPDYETLKRISDYFDVTIDYLLRGLDATKRNDELDIHQKLNSFIDDIRNAHAIHFKGTPIDDRTKRIILKTLQHTKELVQESKSI